MRELFSLPLTIAMLFVPAGASAAPADFVGMSAGDIFYKDDQRYRARELSKMHRAGVRLLRHNFRWHEVEYAPGEYDFSYHDRYVEATARKRIKLLGIIHQAPLFHALRRRDKVPRPRSNRSIAAFSRALVDRYGPRGSFWTGDMRPYRRYAVRSWQVWNEPNLPVYWSPRPNARQYVKMLRAVSAAIHSRDRRAEVVTAGVPNSALGGVVPFARYIRQMYRAGGKSAFDTLAVNAYVRDSGQLRELLLTARRIMNRAGDRRARMWITELGWADRGPRHRFVVGSRGQVERLRSSFLTIRKLRRRYRLRGLVWYQWRDQKKLRGTDDEWGYHTGLLRVNGSRKPAYRAFARYSRGLR